MSMDIRWVEVNRETLERLTGAVEKLAAELNRLSRALEAGHRGEDAREGR